MSEKAENSSNPLDLVKWLVVLVLLGGAVAANSIYEDISVLYRALGVVAAVLVAGFIAASTEKGSSFLTFAKDARTEVRKVVWPTRQEATQTTIIVLVATAFMSLVLWGLDLIIVQLVSFITGLGI
ncbi:MULTISPECIES: preprotein translocase subunit SecE [Paraglaciecola]|jgi:preprotein translocase subunit SecE|uniref:Protein translocase subunit SecE n=6 Tax=Paraglaciecola TaxID=1621534 RepID=K6ZMQ5_9ALTE|nr:MULTISPECIES: preprotein translocase subunit SecE [Paraglaciecola]AEE21627.1 preprotein translocase, SecE subunit [Glaciecola sp. 4H-3-7+YE-5]MAD15751.1 preprotein translocase subunit SecE [Alteromonadaceae bacterium]MBB67378.1 preprotein translocase subunit SecE [Rickettsiales bacterium]ABG39121.1 protein translocase subunit secE/sec61 gamma [Paraglaciecola sp. T6c]MBJ2138286.1 preprotein translocase subunit SecE [Paraglaciecola chathamensis]|tara:strand:+ start:40651 stop:41028 length:378 start_codon:yes stop_codon:yes gene_type:complete